MSNKEKEPSFVPLFGWIVFATAFGLTEAALVVYVRRALGMPPGLDYREVWAVLRPGEALTSAAFLALFRTQGLLGLEWAREAGTLLLLLGAAVAAGRSRRERAGIFLFTFAVWDLSYYAWLRLFIGFPRGLGDTDIYFLIPTAWLGPVWFPVCVVMPALMLLGGRLVRGTPWKRQKRRAPDRPGTVA